MRQLGRRRQTRAATIRFDGRLAILASACKHKQRHYGIGVNSQHLKLRGLISDDEQPIYVRLDSEWEREPPPSAGTSPQPPPPPSMHCHNSIRLLILSKNCRHRYVHIWGTHYIHPSSIHVPIFECPPPHHLAIFMSHSFIATAMYRFIGRSHPLFPLPPIPNNPPLQVHFGRNGFILSNSAPTPIVAESDGIGMVK